MEKLKEIIKYAIIAVIAGGIFGVVKFVQNGAIDIGDLLKSTGDLFLILCFMGLLAVPILRKVLGFNEDGTRPE